MDPGLTTLAVEPIGFVRTAYTAKVQAARQPRAAEDATGRIELLPNRNFEHALEDVEGWDYLWVVFWFHLNRGWRPKVLPPRSTSGRKGVFATRSPHRPNPIGLSAVRLERVEGLTLHVRGIDILDGTPVLDIKPYVPYTDAHPAARSGWLEAEGRRAAGESPADPVARYEVSFDPLAAEQAAWIERRSGLSLRERITATLALGPQPHPYRRIRRDGAGFRLALLEWRARFVLQGREVRVLAIETGYRRGQIESAGAQATEPLALHRAFAREFGSRATAPHASSGND